MKNLIKISILIVALFFVACGPKEINFEELIFISQSDSMHLEEHKAANSSVYVLARQGEENIADIQTAVENNLRKNGYSIVSGPSNAGYIIHISIPNIGTFSDAYLRGMLQSGYGEHVEQKSTAIEADNKLAIVADVLIVARIIPPEVRKRPAVVTTTSKPSKVAEDATRILVTLPEDEDYTLAQARPFLVQRIASKIAASLP